jgi:cyclophilin family peptidyl-prolyl cis-trans isomerase
MKPLLPLAVLVGLLSFASLGCGDDSKRGDDTKRPVVAIETNQGTIKVELNPEKAPITVKNFLAYVDDKFYDGTIFHRVIKDFMIQGGGLEPNLNEKKTRGSIKNESPNGLSNVRGAIAMARKPDPDSATAQFYICAKDKPHLDEGRYCVFGKVVEGMDVVDKINSTETDEDDIPTTVVLIKSIRRLK